MRLSRVAQIFGQFAIAFSPGLALAGSVTLTKANVINAQFSSSESHCIVYINMGQQKNLARGDTATLGDRTGKVADVYATRAKAIFRSPSEDDCASVKSWEAMAAKSAAQKTAMDKKKAESCAKHVKKLKAAGHKIVKDEKSLGKCPANRRARVVLGVSRNDGTYESAECGPWVCWKKAPSAGH